MREITLVLPGRPAHLPIGARQLDAALRRLAAAAGEEEVVDRGVAQRRQALGQLDGARIGVAAVAGAVGQRARLVVHGFRQLAAAVSRRDVPQPGQPVDAFPAVGVRQDRAVALYPDASARVERRLVQRMDQVRLVAREQFSVREIRYGHQPETILAATAHARRRKRPGAILQRLFIRSQAACTARLGGRGAGHRGPR